MPAIPPFVLKKLYVKGSLHAEDNGFALDLKNTRTARRWTPRRSPSSRPAATHA